MLGKTYPPVPGLAAGWVKSEPASTKRDEGQKNPKSWGGAGGCYFQGVQNEQVRLEVGFPWAEKFVIMHLSLGVALRWLGTRSAAFQAPSLGLQQNPCALLPSLIPGGCPTRSCSRVRAHPVGSLCLPPVLCLVL